MSSTDKAKIGSILLLLATSLHAEFGALPLFAFTPMTNRKNALLPGPMEPSLFDPPDLDELTEVSLRAEQLGQVASSEESISSRGGIGIASISTKAVAPGSATPSAATPPKTRRRKSVAASPDPKKPTTPAAAMRPASNSSAAKERRKKRHWRSSLETDIKTEALTRFQKGEDVQSVAHALMLPKSAVSSWYEEYQRGILLASERTLAKAEEPTLF